MFAIPKDEKGSPSFPPTLRYTAQMFFGPNWKPGVPPEFQDGIVEHLAYFLEQMKNGNVLLAGPYSSFGGALIIFGESITTYDQALAVMQGDPWDQSKTTVFVIQGWISNPLAEEKSTVQS
ncbi:MAG TPA: hypothetical protein VNW71_21935 [Thermoanaerobaculia bacterium]|nr:hypothetical protein [Thermoanaerobaculia bacterium]